jgi:hypothetical protein
MFGCCCACGGSFLRSVAFATIQGLFLLIVGQVRIMIKLFSQNLNYIIII